MRHRVDGKSESQKDYSETESEGEVAAARLQRNRGGHCPGGARNIASDNQDRADFGSRSAKACQHCSQQAEAPEPEQRTDAAQSPRAVQDVEITVLPPEIFDHLPCDRRHDRHYQHRLRHHHSRWREQEAQAAEGTGMRQKEKNDQACHYRRQPHQGVHDYDHEVTPWKPQRRQSATKRESENGGQENRSEANAERARYARGRLGFDIVYLVETGEEVGSPGLREVCQQYRDRLKANVLIASDGPRLGPQRPTLFLGARGAFNFDMHVELRDGGHHSGNWGGLLSNPGIILAQALATITSPTGAINVREWLPPPIPNSVRAALADIAIDGGDDAPEIDPGWGEPGLSAAEKVFGWCSFEVLAFSTGNPEKPVN